MPHLSVLGAVAYGACLALLGASAAPASPTAGTSSPGAAVPSPAGDAAYWTAGRLGAAGPIAKGDSASGHTNSSRPAPAGMPQGTYFAGIPPVGTFFVSSPTGNTSCTGSVVHSSGRDLVLTAGHCAVNWNRSGSRRIFVPMYTAGHGAAHQPYGFFPVTSLFVDPRYRPSPPGATVTDLDFAFARLGRDSSNRRIEDVTGALTVRATPGYHNTVTVIGYPGSAHNPQHRAIICTVPTSRLSGYRQMQMICGGYYNGVSGSPWIAHYNAATHTGQVIGEVGGRGGGGNDSDDDWVSYSPIYDRQLMSLYTDAVANRTSRRGPYP